MIVIAHLIVNNCRIVILKTLSLVFLILGPNQILLLDFLMLRSFINSESVHWIDYIDLN